MEGIAVGGVVEKNVDGGSEGEGLRGEERRGEGLEAVSDVDVSVEEKFLEDLYES